MSGHSPEQIPIVFSGLRPGEKLYEELLADADTTLPTQVERVRVARLRDVAAGQMVAGWLAECEGQSDQGDKAVRARLHLLVSEFTVA